MRGLPPRLHLPFDQWPLEDQELWELATKGQNDPFSDGGRVSLAEATLKKRWFAWRRFLGFLKRERPELFRARPERRLAPEVIRQFVAHLLETNGPYSAASQIGALYQTAKMILAREDWTWLRALKQRLHASAPPNTQHRPIITSAQLLAAGERLMQEARLVTRTGHFRLAGAVQYRDGLMFAFLAFMPLRRKNLAALHLHKNVVHEGNQWFVIVSERETKARRPIEFEIPALLQPYLEVYLTAIRPKLSGSADSNALWISRTGGALKYSAILPAITRQSQRILGVRISPHDARDAAATTWAIVYPQHIGIARDLLSHANLRTTTRHYNRARGIEASRAHSQVLADLQRYTRRDRP